MTPELQKIIAEATPPLQVLLIETRQLILTVYPLVTEVPWVRQKTIGYGIGPKKMSQHFCWIALYKQYLNLGFNYGTSLPDPQGLLEGNGKLLRHVPIRQLADLQQPGLVILLEAALQDIQTKHGGP